MWDEAYLFVKRRNISLFLQIKDFGCNCKSQSSGVINIRNSGSSVIVRDVEGMEVYIKRSHAMYAMLHVLLES